MDFARLTRSRRKAAAARRTRLQAQLSCEAKTWEFWPRVLPRGLSCAVPPCARRRSRHLKTGCLPVFKCADYNNTLNRGKILQKGKMMKIITCASYGASGSSAVTDLVAEYSNVHRMSDAEFRFLHDPDGISDLEFQLVECHNRHNAGRALKRFWRTCKFNSGNCIHKRYERFFHGAYLKYSKEYVDALTEFTNHEWWDYDLRDRGELYSYLKKAERRILNAIPFTHRGILSKEIMFFSHPTEEYFLSETKKYVHNLLQAANSDKREYIEVDQIIASQNIDRYLRYFEDPIEVFVIDRDPRDIYLLEKLYYNGDKRDTPEIFCKKFRYIRNSGNPKNSVSSHIHYLQFEDFLFYYNKIVGEVERITGLKPEDHVDKFKYLNPLRSIHNTQVWREHPELAADIRFIEKELKEYLYPFENHAHSELVGIPVTDISKF